MTTPNPTPELLTTGEVARAFRVGPATVTRWAHQGRLAWIKTPGGHRRFSAEQVRDLLSNDGAPLDRARVYVLTNPDGSVLLTGEQAGGAV